MTIADVREKETEVMNGDVINWFWNIPYEDYLKTAHWQAVRSRELQRHPACVFCRATLNLQIHHLRYQLWEEEPGDVVTLCENCHKLVESMKRQYCDAITARYWEMWRDFQDAVDNRRTWDFDAAYTLRRQVATLAAKMFLRLEAVVGNPKVFRRNTSKNINVIFRSLTYRLPKDRIFIKNRQYGGDGDLTHILHEERSRRRD